jgi:hypothetical protein
MFDVVLELQVKLSESPPLVAYMYVKVMGDMTGEISNIKQWRAIGRIDRRLPQVGNGPHAWRVYKNGDRQHIVLETVPGHSWAILIDFPDLPKLSSWGPGFAYNLPFSPHHKGPVRHAKTTSPLPRTNINLQWGVKINASQPNIYDPWEEMNVFQRMFRPSGWAYDNSASTSQVLGALVGGGHVKGHYIFKRDNEKCRVDFDVGGGGFMIPGIGLGLSTEDFNSWGTQVYCTSNVVGQLKSNDFQGAIFIVNLGGGGSAGAGATWDGYLVIFGNVVKSSLVVPDISSWKAAFLCHGQSAATGSPGGSAQFMGFIGTTAVRK